MAVTPDAFMDCSPAGSEAVAPAAVMGCRPGGREAVAPDGVLDCSWGLPAELLAAGDMATGEGAKRLRTDPGGKAGDVETAAGVDRAGVPGAG